MGIQLTALRTTKNKGTGKKRKDDNQENQSNIEIRTEIKFVGKRRGIMDLTSLSTKGSSYKRRSCETNKQTIKKIN